ncbi:E3 ubiquitin-protein ligase RING1-like [Linum grandiflorum]
MEETRRLAARAAAIIRRTRRRRSWMGPYPERWRVEVPEARGALSARAMEREVEIAIHRGMTNFLAAYMELVEKEKAAIEKLEVVDNYLDAEEDCCTICLGEMGGGRVIKLECKHVFHQSCLINWLKTSKTCPLCRFQVLD